MDLKLNSSKQFVRFMEIRNIYYVGFNIMILFIFIILVNVATYDRNAHNIWNTIINQKCGSETLLNVGFQYEAFLLFAVFFSNIGAFVGIKSEMHFTFDGDVEDWNDYNFPKLEEDSSSLMSSFSQSRETQWNHTRFHISLLRLVVLLILSTIFLIPYIFISFAENTFIVFFFKIFLPLSLIFFFIYYGAKPILKKLKLVNEPIFNFSELDINL